ncbi:fatty-acid amide hydrolase [Aureobasidium sp. EXF-10727]|nr:fatty-acid amide hydrolase [Aureobasidium sp. EXF-10727]
MATITAPCWTVRAERTTTARTRLLPVIEVKGVPAGTADFENLRWSILDKFDAKVPKDLRIPQHFIENPPQDVTQIPRSCGILTFHELEITENYDAVGLAAAIAARKYTAVEVVKAFLRRSIICHQITCCLTRWFSEDAIKQAQALDEYLARTGTTVGPLHGVPVSLKEHIPIEGQETCFGFISATMESEEDSDLTALLRNAGAVFYVKTMQPQGLLHLESDSPLGRVLNPFNIQLSAGGSSGGEAALLALRGSVIGVGTDIGGSIRGPAAFCGLYGYKPTAYTLPIGGFIPGVFPPFLNLMPSVGPMCRSLRDLDLFMHSVLEQRPHLVDPLLIPLPWTGFQTSTTGRLKIGVLDMDGFITPMPPITRAISWARAQLSSCDNVQVKSFAPYQAREGLALVRKLFLPDGGAGFRSALAAVGEPEHYLSTAVLDTATDSSDIVALAQLRLDRDVFRRQMASHWTSQDVDVVLMPAFVGPASAHDTAIYKSYTSIWNLVDYPSVAIPTPLVAKAKDVEKYADDNVLGPEDEYVRRAYEDTCFEGAPLGLQLVARKHHDNLLFGALQLLKEPLQLS